MAANISQDSMNCLVFESVCPRSRRLSCFRAEQNRYFCGDTFFFWESSSHSFSPFHLHKLLCDSSTTAWVSQVSIENSLKIFTTTSESLIGSVNYANWESVSLKFCKGLLKTVMCLNFKECRECCGMRIFHSCSVLHILAHLHRSEKIREGCKEYRFHSC